MLHIYRGLPGSGKSTAARKLGILHLEADMFFVRNGVYRYDRNLINAAHDWCFSLFKAAVYTKTDVVVSNVFAKREHIQLYTNYAKKQGMAFEVVQFCRSFGSIHNVPETAMEKFSQQWETWYGETMYDYGESK